MATIYNKKFKYDLIESFVDELFDRIESRYEGKNKYFDIPFLYFDEDEDWREQLKENMEAIEFYVQIDAIDKGLRILDCLENCEVRDDV